MSKHLGVSFFAASLLVAASATLMVLPTVVFGPVLGLPLGGGLLFLMFWRLCFLVAEEIAA